MKKGIETCFHESEECIKIPNFNLDPRYYNLTEDFIFINEEWGSLFYKYIGKMENSKAKETCSYYGKSVHLPLPRFKDENEFYRDHFGLENLWLDLTYNNITDGFETSFGHSYIEINKYDWMNFNLTNKSIQYGVKMKNNGQWLSVENSARIHSVCVYNILPSQDCMDCLDKNFCRFNDKQRQEIQCELSVKQKNFVKRLEEFKGRIQI